MNPDKKRKLLLVEDEPVAAATASAMLRYNGYDVVTAVTGARGVESVRQDSSIELILMDIDLGPGMSGPDAAREILQFRDIPIVFLTSHSEREMVYKVKAITRYGYVIKNSGDFVLLSSIEMAFELFESHMKLKKTSEQLAESEKSIRRKLDSILMPDIGLRHLELADLIDKDALQSLIDKFYLLTGFGIGIIDLKGKVLVAAGWQDICLNFHRAHPETREYCIESDTVLSSGVREGEYKLYKCKNNLWDIATPIMIDGRHVGNIFLGQFFFDDEVPDEEFFNARAEIYGFERDSYLAALRRVPRWKRQDVYNVMDYYTGLAEIIKKLSFGNIRLARAVAERDRINETLAERNGLLSLITDNMSDLIFIIDKDGKYNYVSPSFFRILGYSPSDLEGRSAFDYVHEDDLDTIKSAMSVLFREGAVKAESRYRDRRGNYSWYEISANVIRDSDSSITGAVVVGRDISERKEAALRLEQSDRRYEILVENSPLSIFLVRNGVYIYANPAAALRLGYSSPEEVTGLGVEKTISEESLELIKERIKNAESGRGNDLIELSLVRKDGTPLITESMSLPVILDDGPAILVVGKDITAERVMQMELAESEEKFRTVADNTYNWEFWINGAGEMIYISPSCEEISGYSPSEFREDPELLSRIVYEDDRKSPCLLPGSVSEDPLKNETEFRIRAKSGETKWVAHVCRAVYDKEGKFAGRRGSNRDVTRRHEMEQELYKTYDRVESLWNISSLINVDFKTICDNILEAITRITESPYGFYGFINEGETSMTIHSWSGLAMTHCSMADKPTEFVLSDCGIWAEAVRQRGDLIINDYGKEHTAKKGYPEGHVELQRLMVIPLIKDGGVIAVAAVANKSGEYTEHDALVVKTFISNAQAIIDRKKADDEIKSLLEQKEMLLREVHHRVKNNMNTVAGLLKLQSLSINEPAAVSALNDARSRVQNMMLIYDKLYRSADYKNLNARDYFDNLIDEIIRIFPNHCRVRVNKEIDDFRLDSKILFTMGIMVNEIITNAFKYAFDGIDDPELNFSLSMDEGRILFTVRDNGPGIPAEIIMGERSGFGLNLVSSLAEQLEGTMKTGEGPGAEIKVMFQV